MIKEIGTALMLAAILAVTGCAGNTNQEFKKITKKELVTTEDKASYVFGIDLAKRLEAPEDGFKFDPFIQGFIDQYKKNPTLLSDEEMNVVRMEAKKKAIQAQAGSVESPNKLSPEGNAIATERFMLENKKKEGVITTQSGLQYMIIRQANGPKPAEGDKVRIHYKGSLRLGEVFEDTYASGQPAEFPLQNIVPGFREGLMMMSVGSKFKLFVPPELGYGSKQYATIKPYSILIIEVELLEIIK